MAPRKKPVKTMTDAHKKALQKGREEARIVGSYLELIKGQKPRRGRKRTNETVKRQLAEATAKLAAGVSNPTEELKLIQRKLDLESELKLTSTPIVDVKKLETAFIKVAASFAARRGISVEAWKAVGVPTATLKRAGITK